MLVSSEPISVSFFSQISKPFQLGEDIDMSPTPPAIGDMSPKIGKELTKEPRLQSGDCVVSAAPAGTVEDAVGTKEGEGMLAEGGNGPE